jgi:formamidopyrimidine-DNA glycosylase
MPEGPEVKTVARTLANNLIGKRLGAFWHSEQKLRTKVDHEKIRKLEDRVVDNVDCYGKLLFIDVDKQPALLAQLGMTGQLSVVSRNAPVVAHTHVRWPLIDTDQELRYVDPRRFGLFAPCDAREKETRISRLGPDPFTMDDKDAQNLAHAITRSTRCIKEILLDQSVLVGVGNIYASEALFLARINPLKRGDEVSSAKITELIAAICAVLHQAYENCGTTFSNYVDGNGEKGANQSFLKVFQRMDKPCPICMTPIKRIKQGGRSTFFCSRCQV